MVLLLYSDVSLEIYFHHSEIIASYTGQALKILVFYVYSLSQTPSIACVQALHAELCLRLITRGGYTFTCVCQCVHLVPYVLQGSHGGS